jgi:hypothetical protein
MNYNQLSTDFHKIASKPIDLVPAVHRHAGKARQLCTYSTPVVLIRVIRLHHDSKGIKAHELQKMGPAKTIYQLRHDFPSDHLSMNSHTVQIQQFFADC